MEQETYLHVSPVFNRESILTHGLKPSKPSLQHHVDSFLHWGMFNTRDDKVLYMWESCDKDNKFIKDALYYFAWIKPRNAIKREFDYGKIVHENLFEFDSMLYDVYEIKNITEVSRRPGIRDYHAQEPGDNNYNSLYKMDPKYAHNDKTLVFSKSVEQDIRIIKQASLEYLNGKYRIKILKSVNL